MGKKRTGRTFGGLFVVLEKSKKLGKKGKKDSHKREIVKSQLLKRRRKSEAAFRGKEKQKQRLRRGI